jgi:hypothetical protein
MSMNSIALPKLDSVSVEVVGMDTVKLKGTITKKEPAQDLDGFFKAVHRDAVASRADQVNVDVSELTFVNSSAIRLFVDWATWVKNESTHRYKLRFLTSRHITWQKTSFTALKSLMDGILSFDGVD